MGKITVNLVGAFDRHNYGDILFAQVHTRLIRKNYPNIDINYFSVRETSEFILYGGFKTKSIEFLKNTTGPIVVIGGEVLPVEWYEMVGHNTSPIMFFYLRALKRLLGIKKLNTLLKNILNKRHTYPYIITGNRNVFYTGVSGHKFSSKLHAEDVAMKLEKALSISVRDKQTIKNLSSSEVKLNIKLSPDTALIMSELYSAEELLSSDFKINSRKSNNFDFENYLSFQIAKYLAKNNISEILTQLIKLYRKSNLSIFLVPIGRATGHEDHVPLEKIYKELSKKGIPVAILDSHDITSIMSTIRHSKLYIGTSLHGAITAYSNKLKVCALLPDQVPKLKYYLETWMNQDDYRLSKLEEISIKAHNLLSHEIFFGIDNLKLQQNMVLEDIDNYVSFLNKRA